MHHIIPVYSSYFIIPLVLVLLVEALRRRFLNPRYPPGPRGLPLIGNIRDIPSSCEWKTYAKWASQYKSDIIHLKLLGSHLIVLNSAEAASDLLDKRSAIYSDRPPMPMIIDLIGFETVATMPYNDKWRASRRIFNQFFNVNAVSGFHPQLIKATHDLLYRFAKTPDDFREHIELYTGSLILNITYGIDVESAQNPYLVAVETAMNAISMAGNPGSFMVDYMPILKYVPDWVPGAGFKRKAKEWRKCADATKNVPFDYVVSQMATHTCAPSMASISLERLGSENTPKAQEAIRAATVTSFAAAFDTSVSGICGVILAMVLYPEVLRKAQEELDRVIGQDRLPNFSDLPHLPYINAVINEVHRIEPIVPLGIAHRSTEDDVYKGYFIPAGSLVMGNIWAILHDENMYKDPERFDPERFLKDGKLNPDVRLPEDIAFGFGRRMCPGRPFAHLSLFQTVASILLTFDIGRAVGEDGQTIIPSGEYSAGALCHPLPFKCSIKVRSEGAMELITQAYYANNPGY